MKTKLLLLITTLTLLSTSCIFQDVRVPGPTNKLTTYQLTTDDFKILGTVEAEGTITTWLGLVQTGGNGESLLYEKAKKLGADDISNYSFDLESYSILTFIYNKATWKARATAIKYTTNAKGQAKPAIDKTPVSEETE